MIEARPRAASLSRCGVNALWLCAGWVTAIFVLLLLSGIGWHFKLSDSVLLAAIGSTTANILGIFYIVARYLFPKKRD